MLRVHAVAVAVAVSFLAVGCTEQTTEDAPSTTRSTKVAEDKWVKSRQGRAAAPGPLIRGSGYAFHAPKGWGQPRHAIPGFDPDIEAMNLRDRDAFTDNLNVARYLAGPVPPAQAEAAALRELEAAGARDVEAHPRVEVAGDPAAHISATTSLNGRKFAVEQFYLPHGSETYIVTFSFRPHVSALERYLLTKTTLATWTWSP